MKCLGCDATIESCSCCGTACPEPVCLECFLLHLDVPRAVRDVVRGHLAAPESQAP